MKIPKNNEAKAFTIRELLKDNTFHPVKLYFINNLKISPSVLPAKTFIISTKSKA